jgi:cyclic pyranopterin monophosphate synthase
MKKLTHIDEDGNARMVDVGEKPDMRRMARASGHISLSPETIVLVKDNKLKKGDVLTVAEVAGIQAAKQTFSLIPLCHTLLTERVLIRAYLSETGITVDSEVHSTGKTGVEMEALTGVSVALLTVYDMCKAVDKKMEIGSIRLIEKTKENL